MRIDYEMNIEPNQSYVIDSFKPEYAKGIAGLIVSVYGLDYPFGIYYYPEKIIEENNKNNIYSIVAKTPKGDIIGYGALYLSSPINNQLYEVGQMIIHKDYRKTFAVFQIYKYIMDILIPSIEVDGIFGESVSNHTTTQKLGERFAKTKDFAIELDLMPEDAYIKEQSAKSRVTCVIQEFVFFNEPQKVFIPEEYTEEIAFILENTNLKRDLLILTGQIPSGTQSDIQERFFSNVGVARMNVISIGSDFEQKVREIEDKGVKENIQIYQYFVNLKEPWARKGIKVLREHGCFLGGYIPLWFGSDGLLMQKVLTETDYSGIKLYSEKAQKLLEYIKKDRNR